MQITQPQLPVACDNDLNTSVATSFRLFISATSMSIMCHSDFPQQTRGMQASLVFLLLREQVF